LEPSVICEYCHQEFTPRDAYRRKYCSPRHKNLAGAKARAERNLTLTERRCYRCQQVKPTEEFGSGGTHTYCKACINAWQRERLAALPLDQRRAAARA
jgi:late competence protein required for DNA uptake (superfamily II DNA/RNA helicase)